MALSMFVRKRRRRRIRPHISVNIWRACWLKAGRGQFWKRCSGRVAEKNPKPLAGKRVVVTRALEQSQSLVDALREAGAEPVLLPLVTFAPADNVPEIDRHLKIGVQFD